MATGKKITEIWLCVRDDGAGTDEGILSKMRVLTAPEAQQMGFPSLSGTGVMVPFITYDASFVQRMVNKAQETGKQFRVLHFHLTQDVTAQYIHPATS